MKKVDWVKNQIKQLKEYHKRVIESVSVGELVNVESDVVERFADFLYGEEIFDFLPVEKVNNLAKLFKTILDVERVVSDVQKALDKEAVNLDEKLKSAFLDSEQYDHQAWLDKIFLTLFLKGVVNKYSAPINDNQEWVRVSNGHSN